MWRSWSTINIGNGGEWYLIIQIIISTWYQTILTIWLFLWRQEHIQITINRTGVRKHWSWITGIKCRKNRESISNNCALDDSSIQLGNLKVFTLHMSTTHKINTYIECNTASLWMNGGIDDWDQTFLGFLRSVKSNIIWIQHFKISQKSLHLRTTGGWVDDRSNIDRVQTSLWIQIEQTRKIWMEH